MTKVLDIVQGSRVKQTRAVSEAGLTSEFIIDLKNGPVRPSTADRPGTLLALRELAEEFEGRDDEAIVGMAAEEFTTDARLHPERYSFLADWFGREASLRRRPNLVVDVGCGPGVLTRLVAQKLPVASVLGVDLSPDMLRLASEGQPLDRIQFIQGDGRGVLDLAQRPVDALISRRMIHRVDGLDTVLRRMAEAVRADGGVVLNYSFRCPTEETDQQAFRDAASQRASLKSLHAAFVRAVMNAPTLEDYVRVAYAVGQKLDLSRCLIKVFPFDVGIVMVR